MGTLDRNIYKEIDLCLERIYPESMSLAEKVVKAGLKEKSQMRGFETLINATTRFSEIQNFIKNQAGKESEKEPKWRTVASLMLEQLDALETEAHKIAGSDPQQILDVKLRLARGWAKQVVCHYMYKRPIRGGNGSETC